MNIMKFSMNILISHIFSYISLQKLCFVKNGSNFFVDMQVSYKSQSLNYLEFLSSPIARAACERTELLRTEITLRRRRRRRPSKLF